MLAPPKTRVGTLRDGWERPLELDWERPGDRLFEKNGAKFLLDARSSVYLAGMELDYCESIKESGFVLRASRAGKSAESGVAFPFPYSDAPPVPAIW